MSGIKGRKTRDAQGEIPGVVRRYIEDAGSLSQVLGLGRAIGQIYALVYFSPQPRSLSDMKESLGISRGSASMNVRQLEQWGAVRKVWIKGDRKDYYEANDWLGQIVRNILIDTIGRRLAQSGALFSHADTMLVDADHPDADFVRARIEHLQKFQVRVKKTWQNPLVKKLMG